MKKLIYTTYHSKDAKNEQRQRAYALKAKLVTYQSNKIIAFAKWSKEGKIKAGYKILNGIDTCFNLFYTKNGEWYLDDTNLVSTQVHNGGINYFTFRELKNNDNQKLVIEKILNGTLTRADITKYTRSLKPIVEDLLYGVSENQEDNKKELCTEKV